LRVRPMLALLGLLYWGAGAQAEEAIAVIAGVTPPHIAFGRRNLRDIFLKRIVIDQDGTALVPLNLAPGDPLRIAFSLAVLGKRPDGLERYWTERYFHGVSPPYVVHSEEAMLRFVTETPGAVGYVALCRVDDRVKVVARLPVPRKMARKIHEVCAH